MDEALPGVMHDEVKTGPLTQAEMRANVLRLAFGGSQERFDAFVRTIREEIPPATGVVLRGSAITGCRWRDGAAFDSDGPGTSDLDLTLVGDTAIGLFTVTGFFVPGVHSRPLSDEDPDIALCGIDQTDVPWNQGWPICEACRAVADGRMS